ncbi:hypothetical protein NL676_003704 [Syzygium grande]|nr:hypothetical protein NL676_003704 [Syzygium grande]
MRSHEYYKGSIALAPYGTYWLVSRRLLMVDMLVPKRLNETAPIRRKCVNNMLTWIGEAASADKVQLGEVIHLAHFVFLMASNLLGNLVLSQDLLDVDSKVGSEFFVAMTGLMEWSGRGPIPEAAGGWTRKG